MQTKILLLFFVFVSTFADQLYKKVIHTTDPDAKCLDGSPPLLYLHEGTDKTKFLLFFIGGGLCSGLSTSQTIEDCYQRSKTNLGSSSIDWPDTLQGSGYLSTDPSKSKFANWTKIVFGYCDGSLHQGNRKSPIPYKGINLYFRGAVITRSHIKWIQNNFNFHSAQKVVVTGSSAGGIATASWTNYIRSKVANQNNVVGVQDSGVFLNFTQYSTNLDYLNQIVINMFKIANIDEKTPLEMCNLRHHSQQYKCLFFEYSYTSIGGRFMIVNSQYDAWAIPNILGLKCLSEGSSGETIQNCNNDEREYIQRYRQKFKDVMEYYTMMSVHSAWTIGCAHHGYTFDDQFYNSPKQLVPTTTGISLQQAVENFVFEEGRVIAMQTSDWPANAGCAK